MRADPVVMRSRRSQNSTQLYFVEHDQVIEAFAPHRSDEALAVAKQMTRRFISAENVIIVSRQCGHRRDSRTQYSRSHLRKQGRRVPPRSSTAI